MRRQFGRAAACRKGCRVRAPTRHRGRAVACPCAAAVNLHAKFIHISEKHLPKYLAEFEYRWNLRSHPHAMLDRLMVSFARQTAVGRAHGMEKSIETIISPHHAGSNTILVLVASTSM